MACKSFHVQECAVFRCLNKWGYSFPENAELRQKWVDALALEDCNYRPKDSSFVCSKHFLSSDYDDSTIDSETKILDLKKDAIPSVSLRIDNEFTSKFKWMKTVTGSAPALDEDESQALFKSACKKCNHTAEQCLQCRDCEKHFHVRCAGRASSVVMLGLDYLKCRKKCGESDTEEEEECPVVPDEISFERKFEATAIEPGQLETSTHPSHGDASGSTSAVVKGTGVTASWLSAIERKPTSTVSSTDDNLFVIPVEELIIKEEPVEIPDHNQDMMENAVVLEIQELLLPNEVIEGKSQVERVTMLDSRFEKASTATKVQPVRRRVNQSNTVESILKNSTGSTYSGSKNNFGISSTTGNTSKARILIKNTHLKNFGAKRTLQDFSEKDMKNPHYAVQFYALAKELLKANLLLEDKNVQLKGELKDLKKKIKDGGVDVCGRCTRMQRRLGREPAVNDGSLKRKAENDDDSTEMASDCEEPIETLSITMKRQPAPDALLAQESKAHQKSNKLDAKGPYRIAALEYFINAISDMQCLHMLRCKNKCRMRLQSETLSGISGEWTFGCPMCGFTKTIPTEPNYYGINKEGSSPWLKWLGSLPQRHLGYAQTFFEKLDVPFYYSFTPTTLKVAIRKRTILNS